MHAITYNFKIYLSKIVPFGLPPLSHLCLTRVSEKVFILDYSFSRILIWVFLQLWNLIMLKTNCIWVKVHLSEVEGGWVWEQRTKGRILLCLCYIHCLESNLLHICMHTYKWNSVWETLAVSVPLFSKWVLWVCMSMHFEMCYL